MSSKGKLNTPKAELHTPEELLAGAESLLLSSDPQLMRAVVLEAITALEAYVHTTVFGILEKKLDPLLIKWLEKRTRMDFDSRLSVLTPVATGQPINKGAALWENYKKAKTIRNRVTHSGRKVTVDEAKLVVQTVYDWMAYLGSTAEIELALWGLKKYIERNKLTISKGVDGSRIVADYFSRTKAASTELDKILVNERDKVTRRADIILTFGQHTVLVETKLLIGTTSFESLSNGAVNQALTLLETSSITRGAIVLFYRGVIPEYSQKVRTVEDGKISIVEIQVS